MIRRNFFYINILISSFAYPELILEKLKNETKHFNPFLWFNELGIEIYMIIISYAIFETGLIKVYMRSILIKPCN